jgi:uncharacterized protein YsxB (DUF464 family)
MRSSNSRHADDRRASTEPACMEPLESRRLLADTGLSGVFGGTITFASLTNSGGSVSGSNILDNRHHAVLNISQANDNGLVSGTFRIDDVGRFHFTGSNNNGIVSLVFTGSAGSGSISAKVVDAAVSQLKGEMFNRFGGTNQFAVVRLAQSSAASAAGNAALLPTVTSDASALASAVALGNLIDVTGSYSGMVHFTGGSLPGKTRAHAVLHISGQDEAGNVSGTLRIDRVGRFQFSGTFTTTGGLDLVFANGASSGSVLLKLDLPGNGLVAGNAGSVSGKVFARVGSTDAHGSVRLNAVGSTLGNNLVNVANPIAGSLIPVQPTTVGAAGTITTMPPTINTPIDTSTGIGSIGTSGFDFGVGSGMGIGSGMMSGIDLMNGIGTGSPFSSAMIG